MKCLSCGNEFPPSLTKPSTFCSPKCRLRHHRQQKKANPQLSSTLAEPEPQTSTKPLQTQADLDQQAHEDYRRSLAYTSLFPPNTTFLPFNHPIPQFRGLAVPSGMNHQAYLPTLPRHFHGAKNQPRTTIQALKDSLTKPL